MKKNFRNFLLVTVITALIGTALFALAEYIFGLPAVFITAVIVVAIAGVAVMFKPLCKQRAINRVLMEQHHNRRMECEQASLETSEMLER